MDTNDMLLIRLTIGNQSYPMKVNREDEERFRKAAALINDRLTLYKQRFETNKKTDYDFLAMVTIDLVSRYLDKENSTNDTELLSELRIMSTEIDDYILKSNAL